MRRDKAAAGGRTYRVLLPEQCKKFTFYTEDVGRQLFILPDTQWFSYLQKNTSE